MKTDRIRVHLNILIILFAIIGVILYFAVAHSIGLIVFALCFACYIVLNIIERRSGVETGGKFQFVLTIIMFAALLLLVISSFME
jgi:hypothetical protein